MEIDGFIDKIDFKKQIDDWILAQHQARPDTNGRSPGDPERAAKAIRNKEAVPLLKRAATLKSPSK